MRKTLQRFQNTRKDFGEPILCAFHKFRSFCALAFELNLC